MENSNNTGKILVFFTAIVFLFFVYEVMTNTNKVSQVNVPLKQPSEIVININEKNNNKNNSPAPPPPPPSPTPPAPAPFASPPAALLFLRWPLLFVLMVSFAFDLDEGRYA